MTPLIAININEKKIALNIQSFTKSNFIKSKPHSDYAFVGVDSFSQWYN